ncbi:outer dynein arm-docking complex subunit 3-like isoform X2 [Betta splendens]|uniref:Outer dynein arm-docking complex subunit 3-like isoform X2 n=1 Tax=Betta splendens TaxID=158456 RepID=A0A6P7NKS9_BETSP|nr:outer dynein arm-docking complex subunit 3-like isoform X2 [Betta splendens]
MAETQRSIHLEGDTHTCSQASIKQNRDAILQLRLENKRLHRELAEAQTGDEQVIKEAFHNRGMEKDAYRNMSVKEAQAALDRRVLSSVKRLNALRHITGTYQQHLEQLHAEYGRMSWEGSSDAHARREEEAATSLRALEIGLVKMCFKSHGAENITTSYLKIRSHLKEERRTFQGQLDSLETEILKHKEQLRRLQVKNNDAQRLKDVTKTQLEQQDKLLHKELIERKSIVASFRRKVEEDTSKAERIDTETLETHIGLEKMKAMNETVLQQLNEQMELLSRRLQDMKGSREATLSRVQQQLDAREQRLQAHQQRRDAAKRRLDWLVRALGAARARLQRLAGRLGHITQFCVRTEGEPSTSSGSKLCEDPFDEEEKTEDHVKADLVSLEASVGVSLS